MDTSFIKSINVQEVILAHWFAEVLIPFGDIGTSFPASGTRISVAPVTFLKIFNGTDKAVTISFDGYNAHLTLQPSETFEHLAISNRRTCSGTVWLLATAAPTTGSVIFNGYY